MSKYTDEEIELLKEEYDGSPEKVLELSKRMNRTVHSLRSKLCAMGIYVSPFDKPKYGTTKVITKEDLVAAIEKKLFELAENRYYHEESDNTVAKPQPISLGSLTKAGKLDLVNLAKILGIQT